MRFANSPGAGWRGLQPIVATLGLALVANGVVGQVLAYFPAQWRRPEWEVAYYGEFSATLALLVLGLVVLGASALGSGRRSWAATVGVVCVGLACWSLYGSGLVALDLPLVFRAASSVGTVEQATGMRLVGIKGIALSALYGTGLLWMGATLLGRSGRKTR